LRTIGLGNENCEKGGQPARYEAYYRAFESTLHAAHPDLELVSSCANASAFAPPRPNLFDVHLYGDLPPDYFDHTPRTPGIGAFVSEYAAGHPHTSTWRARGERRPYGDQPKREANTQVGRRPYGDNSGGDHPGGGHSGGYPTGAYSWANALSEAAFALGLVRNSDFVRAAAYAPLLVHERAADWSPNAIVFNASHVAPSPSWFVQELLGAAFNGKGKQLLRSSATGGVVAVAAYEPARARLILAIVHNGSEASEVSVRVDGAASWWPPRGTAEVSTLWSANLSAVNTLAAPDIVVPRRSQVPATARAFVLHVAPYSLSVLTLDGVRREVR